MHTTDPAVAKDFAKSLKGDADISVATQTVAGKVIVDIVVTGRTGTLGFHGECYKPGIEAADAIFDHKVEDTIERFCVSDRGIAIWLEGGNRIRFLYRHPAGHSPGCIQSFNLDKARSLAA